MNVNFESDHIVELNKLRALCMEKDIQIEAMMEFEQEYELKVRDLLNQRDLRIDELEAKLTEVRCKSSTPNSAEGDLINTIQLREAEVQALEHRVQEILSERRRDEDALRESVSESLMEYENRVEELRRELLSKERDLIRLQEDADAKVFQTTLPRETLQEMEALRARVRELENPANGQPSRGIQTLESVILSLEGVQKRPALSMVGQIVSLSPRHSPSQPDDETCRLRRTLEENIDKSRELLEAFIDSKLQKLADVIESNSERTMGFPKLCLNQADEFKRLAERYRQEAGRFRQLSEAAESVPRMKMVYEEIRASLAAITLTELEREQLILLRAVDDANNESKTQVAEKRSALLTVCSSWFSVIVEPVEENRFEKDMLEEQITYLEEQLAHRDSAVGALKEQVASGVAELARKKELLDMSTAENLELHKSVMDLTRQIAVTESLHREMVQLRDQVKVKKDQIREIKDRLNETKRELIDTKSAREGEIEQLKKQCADALVLREQVTKLQTELDMRDKVSKKSQRLPKATVFRKDTSNLSIVKCDSVRWLGSVTPIVSSRSEGGAREDIRAQLYSTQDELMNLRRKYEVEEKFALEMEKLKNVSLENENVRLRAKVDDLEYQFGRLVRLGNATEEYEILRLRVALDCKETEIQKAEKEKLRLAVEILQEKNKGLETDFDRAVMEMRIERLEYALSQKHPGSLLTNASTRESSPTPQSHETSRLRGELADLRERLQAFEKTNAELKKQRDQDKAALQEAERVLELVQATEKKYVKVAKENAKLRKDLASLDDDNFWNDLDMLQDQFKHSVEILKQVRHDKTYINHRPALAQEIDKVIG